MALKKTTNRIVISDESVNSYGFRTITNGISLMQYEKNPVFLWMHYRANKGTKDEVLPIGIVTDLKIEDGKLTGQPQFDDTDEFAMKLYNKFESGIIRMSSPGLYPVKFDDKKELMLAGQTLPTLTKSVLKEVSLCDIGSNDNALQYPAEVVLYDENDAIINLSDKSFFNKYKIPTPMTNISLAAVAKTLNLKDDAAESDIVTAINSLKKEKDDAVQKLADLVKSANADKIKTLLDKAEADRKLTAPQRAHFEKLALSDFDSAKSIIDSMPSYQSAENSVQTGKSGGAELEALKKLSAKELWKDGKMERLKELDEATFKLKYKELYGEDYK